MSKLNEEDFVRLLATRFVRKGFRGRARLALLAEGGDLVALAKLEERLGLANRTAVPAAYEEVVERKLRAGEFSPAVEKQLLQTRKSSRLKKIAGLFAKNKLFPAWYLPLSLATEIREKQSERASEKYNEPEPTTPAYQRFLEKKLLRQLRFLYPHRFYSISREIQFMPRGGENAFGPFSGRRWGAKKQVWQLSPRMLNAETVSLQAGNRKHVYLSAEKRVKRGPYGTLVVEVRAGTKYLDFGTVPRWIRARKQED
jgi:hypothetical protein